MEHCLQNPDLERVRDLLEEYARRDFVVQLNGLCRVHYQGRAKSTLDRGERMVIIKQDDALLVHGPDRYQPKNWQPVVDGWDVQVRDDEKLLLKALRKDPEEVVEITFDDVHLLVIDQLVDRADLQVRGHEVDIHEAIEEDPAIIEEGLTVIEREKKTDAGYIDVFARDEDNGFVVVEVKRNPDHNTVLQLERYLEEIEDEYAGDIRGIIAAPDISSDLLDYLEDRGMEYAEVDMADVIKDYTLPDRQKNLGQFGND